MNYQINQLMHVFIFNKYQLIYLFILYQSNFSNQQFNLLFILNQTKNIKMNHYRTKNLIYIDDLEEYKEEEYGQVQGVEIDEYQMIESDNYTYFYHKLKLCTNLNKILINFESVDLSLDGFELVLQALQSLQNFRTFKIQLKNLQVSDEIFQQLGLYLNSFCRLEKIQVEIILCKVSYDAYLNLVKQFANIPNLIKLKLAFIDNECNDQVQNFKEEIKFEKLQKIKLHQSKIIEGNSNFCINLSECQNLKQVFINFQDSLVNDKQLIQFSQTLSKLNQITALNLNFENNQIQNDGIVKLAESISLNQFETLFIKLRNNQITQEGLQKFFYKLKQNNALQNLTLILSKNKVEGDLFQVFMHLSKFQSLKKLELVLDENYIELNQELQISTVNQMSDIKLSLNKCSLSQQSLNNILRGLSQFQSIKNLSLQFQLNYFGSSFAQVFTEQLCRFNQLNSLSLNLDDNIGFAEYIPSIPLLLIKFSCLKYLSLGLSNCHLGIDQVTELIQNLSKLPSLVGLQIDLYQNNLVFENLIKISKQICKFQNLQSIKMRYQQRQLIMGSMYQQVRKKLFKCLRLCLIS
ncbi:hypothetical protein ABPG74_005795 [Tetrahymena malaccensis]